MAILGLTTKTFANFVTNDDRLLQYARFEAEPDPEKIIPRLGLIERLFPDQVLMLCNRSHPKIRYIGKNCKTVIGHDEDEFMQLSIIDFMKRIHPDDLPALQKCFDTINNFEPYDPITRRFVLNYRLKNADGKFVHVADEKLAIINDEGRYIYFSLFRNVPGKFFHVKLDVYTIMKGKYIKSDSFIPRQQKAKMTPRQKEVIELLIGGLSNQEIADRLALSINTVKNHKQQVFRRANVNSSLELASYARDFIGKDTL